MLHTVQLSWRSVAVLPLKVLSNQCNLAPGPVHGDNQVNQVGLDCACQNMMLAKDRVCTVLKHGCFYVDFLPPPWLLLASSYCYTKRCRHGVRPWYGSPGPAQPLPLSCSWTHISNPMPGVSCYPSPVQEGICVQRMAVHVVIDGSHRLPPRPSSSDFPWP